MRTVIFFYVAALVLLVVAALFIAQNNRDYLTSIVTQSDDEKVGPNLINMFTKQFSCHTTIGPFLLHAKLASLRLSFFTMHKVLSFASWLPRFSCQPNA